MEELHYSDLYSLALSTTYINLCSWNNTALCIIYTGAIALTNDLFSEKSTPSLIQDINCTGTEHSLLQCSYNTLPETKCGQFDDAGVVCQG